MSPPPASVDPEEESSSNQVVPPHDDVPLVESRLPVQTGFTLSVKIIEAEGVAGRPDGTPPFCVAKLRLLYPEEEGELPDHLVASAPGEKTFFEQRSLTYMVPEEKLEQTQLELTMWDRAGPDDSFVGEVLLNVNKLLQISGKYFEHAFPLKTSSVYSSAARNVSGSLVLGLRMDPPTTPGVPVPRSAPEITTTPGVPIPPSAPEVTSGPLPAAATTLHPPDVHFTPPPPGSSSPTKVKSERDGPLKFKAPPPPPTFSM